MIGRWIDTAGVVGTTEKELTADKRRHSRTNWAYCPGNLSGLKLRAFQSVKFSASVCVCRANIVSGRFIKKNMIITLFRA